MNVSLLEMVETNCVKLLLYTHYVTHVSVLSHRFSYTQVKLSDIQVLETSYNLPAGEPHCAPGMISVVDANVRILQDLVAVRPWTSVINELLKERLRQTKDLVSMISSANPANLDGQFKATPPGFY